jgi:leader peptidase (prepilin peptidase) / N-methyltransferase
MSGVFSPFWLAVGAVIGAAAGPVVRAAIFSFSVPADAPWRVACRECDSALVGSGRRLVISALRPSGRCSTCRARVGPPAAVVELSCAASIGLLAGFLGPHPATLAFVWAALVGVALAFVDIGVHRLPDRLVATGLVGTFVLLAIATAAGAPPHRLLTAVLCALASGLVFFVMVFVSPRGMGLGDAKLALLTGLATGWFGPWAAVYGAFFGLLFAGIVGIGLIIIRRVHRRDSIAIGPFLVLGALAAVLIIG